MDSVQIFWLINASLTLIYVTMQQDLSSQTEWRIVKCLFINNFPLFYIEMFIDFNLNQLYRNTPFKENETWCTHTETHFFVKFLLFEKKTVFSMHASTIHFRSILTYFMTLSAWKCMQEALVVIPLLPHKSALLSLTISYDI